MRQFAYKRTVPEYEQDAKDLTDIELKKLFKSKAYKKMISEKGSNISNWNWQIRERDYYEKEREDI